MADEARPLDTLPLGELAFVRRLVAALIASEVARPGEHAQLLTLDQRMEVAARDRQQGGEPGRGVSFRGAVAGLSPDDLRSAIEAAHFLVHDAPGLVDSMTVDVLGVLFDSLMSRGGEQAGADLRERQEGSGQEPGGQER